MMLLSPFRRRADTSCDSVAQEAERLIARHGCDEAVQVVRKRIAAAGREERRRLYRLNDEIVRRAEAGD